MFGKKDNQWTINGLDGDEEIIEVFTDEQIIRRPTLDHSWPFYDVPWKVPKDWKKGDSDWKKVDKYFMALTNKRWAVVDYDTKSIIRNFPLSECQFLAGANIKRNVAGNYTSEGGTITIMMGTNRLWTTGHIHNHLQVHQTILHLQGQMGIQPTLIQQQTPFITNQIQPTIQNVQPASLSHEDPLKILKLRFARGEITKEEFEETKRMLE